MFNRKKKEIIRLKKEANIAGTVIKCWKDKHDKLQEDVQTWSKRWGELGKRYEILSAENKRLKNELVRIRNRFSHIEISTEELTQKIKRFKNEIIERNYL